MNPPGRRPPSPWLRTAATGLVASLKRRGITLTEAAAADVVADRLAAVAAALHISERAARAYIDQEALDGMAEALVESVSDEAPGADLLALPRDGALRVSGIGRLFAGLAQCAHFFSSTYSEVDELLSLERSAEIMELISVLGLVQAGYKAGDAVFAPRALFIRISRILDSVADLTADAEVRGALRSDALIARAGSKAHRWPPPPVDV